MRIEKFPSGSRAARAGIVVLGVTAATVISVASPAMAGVATLNQATGPSTGGNTLTATHATPVFALGNSVQFQYKGTVATAGATLNASCKPDYDETGGGSVALANVAAGVLTAGLKTVPPAEVSVLSAVKIAFVVPTALVLQNTQVTQAWNVCVYSGAENASPLIATATYTISAAPTITSIAPTAGSSQGGTKITVYGAALPTATGALTATIGGSPITGIAVSAGGTSFTGLAPAHTAGGPFAVAVTTAGGTVSKAGLFTYSNGLQVTPNTGPNTRGVTTYVDVTGNGFSELIVTPVAGVNGTTGLLPQQASAHVFLVDGVYSPLASTGDKTLPQTTECINVLIVSDVELICALALGYALLDTGLMKAETGAAVTVAAAAITDTTIVGAPAVFSAADVGKIVTDTNLPANAIITAVNGTGTTATLSKAYTGTGTTGPIVKASIPVPIGTYTVTVVNSGAVDAQLNTASYSQSIISSGSTFTVADY